MEVGEIIGIAVGGVAFAVCVVLGFFYCYKTSQRKTGSAQAAKGNRDATLEKGQSIVNGRMEVPLGLDESKEKHVHNPLYRRDSAVSLASSSPHESPSKRDSVAVEKPVIEEPSGFDFEETAPPQMTPVPHKPHTHALPPAAAEEEADGLAPLPSSSAPKRNAGEQEGEGEAKGEVGESEGEAKARRATFAETGVMENSDPEREARKKAMQERRNKKKQEEWQLLLEALSVIDTLSVS